MRREAQVAASLVSVGYVPFAREVAFAEPFREA